MTDSFTELLSGYLDEELSPVEQARVERHLQVCLSCQDSLEGLRRVVGRAKALPVDVLPNDLWPEIAARIDASSVLARPAKTNPPRPRRLSISRPQLLAASVLLAAISGGAVWLSTQPPLRQIATGKETDGPIARAQATLTSAVDRTHAAAVSELEEALRAGRTRLDTVTVRILEENLQIIDRAIADARRAVLADPGDHYLDQHLAETMRRKLQLLRKAVELTASAS